MRVDSGYDRRPTLNHADSLVAARRPALPGLEFVACWPQEKEPAFEMDVQEYLTISAKKLAHKSAGDIVSVAINHMTCITVDQ